MIADDVEAIADAILYEGYLLYPYRRSALKNRGWTIGVIPPHGGPGEGPRSLGCECVVTGGGIVTATARFLVPQPAMPGVPRAVSCAWPMRPVPLAALERESVRSEFEIPAGHRTVAGRLELSARATEGAHRVGVSLANLTRATEPEDGGASFVSAHVLLRVEGGEFAPPRDRPDALVAGHAGLWPILVGDASRRDQILCSPIIIDDYPVIAPESRGSLFDGTEIEEMLALRILTLTAEERAAIEDEDPRVLVLIQRTEGLGPTDLARLHGAARPPAVQHSTTGEAPLAVGARVRLRPARRADIFDLALAGKAATIRSIEQDLDGRTYFAVTVDSDPGRDLGEAGRPGHRFFFGPDEIEPLS